jgi:hypothetical protein
MLCLHSPADQHTKDTVSVAEQIGISPSKIILFKFCFQAQRLEEQLCALLPIALAKKSMLGILLTIALSTRQKAYARDTSSDVSYMPWGCPQFCVAAVSQKLLPHNIIAF